MAHDNLGMTPLKYDESSLSVLGKLKGGDGRGMSVEEYNMNPVTIKEGHVNNGPPHDVFKDNEISRRHSLSSSFRYLRRTSRNRPKVHKMEKRSSPPRRRSIAGTFVTDTSLGFPRRAKAHSFAPDGRRDERVQPVGNIVSKEPEKGLPEKEYDPFKERVVKHPTTNIETLLHVLKGSMGTGILAMPNAFHNAGWALGFVGTIIIGTVCTYCIHLLIRCEHELCRRKRIPALNYQATAEVGLLEGPKPFHKLAPFSGHIVNFFILSYQLGICCVYVVFVSSNVKDVVDLYYNKIDVRIYMVIFLLPLILINYVRNLKYLAPFSAISNIITFIGFGIILYYLFEDLHSLSEREPVGEVQNWPLFFGTVLFSLEAIGVIMPLENEMKNPKSFGGPFGVLNIAMGIIVFLYTGMGFFGYLRYGDEAKGSITLNIPTAEPLAQVVKITMAFAIFITHSLQNYVAIDIIWNGYVSRFFEGSRHKIFYEYVVRTVLVLFTFLLGVAIPNLELFISLVGAFCLAVLGIAFPAIIDQTTFWNERKGFSFVRASLQNVILIFFGVFGLIVGTYVSVANIYEFFSKGEF